MDYEEWKTHIYADFKRTFGHKPAAERVDDAILCCQRALTLTSITVMEKENWAMLRSELETMKGRLKA